MNSQVDDYYGKPRKWQPELLKLREVLLGTPLLEEMKWGKPCYSFDGRNVIVVQPFKEYCALLFCKGALLKDPEGLLVKPGENTQASRQLRFAGLAEINKKKTILKAYLKEAVAVEKAGLEVTYKSIDEHPAPEELQRRLQASPALKNAFEALTPGRRRAYYIFISGAKQPKTREARIDKCTPRILHGKGLTDL